MSKKVFLKGTLILACTGLISRLAGFFYRIFLSHSIGAEGMGLYQLALPIQGLMAALSYAGIQSALSRLISAKLTLHRKKDARFSLILGTVAAVILSAMAGFFLFENADFFAKAVLKEPKTSDLLRLIGFTVPVCAIHACIDSYYYARKKAIVPAAVQLTEQAVRIGASYVLYLICLRESRPVTALIAAGGSLAGEIAASLVSLLAITFYFGNCHFSETDVRTCRTFSLAKEIFGLSFPISLNRILLTLLGSIEVVLIPQMLLRFGLTASDSLQIYGIFTGMALPLILFLLRSQLPPLLCSCLLWRNWIPLETGKKFKRLLTRLFFFACCLVSSVEQLFSLWDRFSDVSSFTVPLPEHTSATWLSSALFSTPIQCLPVSSTVLADRDAALYIIFPESWYGSSLSLP